MTPKFSLFPAVLLLSALAFSCTNNTPKAPADAPVSLKMEHIGYKKCVKDTICAEVKIDYPVLAGGKAEIIKSINDSLVQSAKLWVYDNSALSMAVTVDSAGLSMYNALEERYKEDPEYGGVPYFTEVECKNVLLNSRFFSVEFASYSFMGGAHGNYGVDVATYDLNTGKKIALTEIVSDTSAIRSLLEKAFVADKTEAGQPAPTLSELLFPEFEHLPMPLTFCVAPEGLRVVYNPYEVAAYAVGGTDVVLTWEQLGALADRKKWIE